MNPSLRENTEPKKCCLQALFIQNYFIDKVMVIQYNSNFLTLENLVVVHKFTPLFLKC